MELGPNQIGVNDYTLYTSATSFDQLSALFWETTEIDTRIGRVIRQAHLGESVFILERSLFCANFQLKCDVRPYRIDGYNHLSV